MNAILTLLERRTLPGKLALVFLTLLLSLGLGAFSLSTQHALMVQLQKTYEADYVGLSSAKNAQIQYALMGRALRQALIAPTTLQREQALQQMNAAEGLLRSQLAELRGKLVQEEAKGALLKYEDAFAVYKRKVDNVTALMAQGQLAPAMIEVASDAFQSAGQATTDAMTAVVRIKEDGARAAIRHAEQDAAERARLVYTLMAVTAVLGVVLVWGIALSIRRPSERVRRAVERIAQGQLDTPVPHSDFGNEIGSLARSIQVLQSGALKTAEQSWIKTSLAAVSNKLQTATQFVELSQTLFSAIAPLVKIGHGVLYVYEDEPRRLRLLGGYAYRERKSLEQYFALGQGLVGQCAMERTPITLTEPPPDYVRIGSSLGDTAPKAITVLPVLRNDRLLGVLELATLHGFGEKEQALLDGLMPLLGMNMEILERSVKTSKLLEETRRQSRAMQEQAATLEEQAVELEAQKESLQATESWYRGIIESAPDGLLVTDERGAIRITNPRILAIFGYGDGALIGRTLQGLMPGIGGDAHRGELLGPGVESASQLLTGVRQDGTQFPVEVGLSRLPSVGGRGECVCVSVRDISERKAAEKAVADQRAALQNILDHSPVGTAFSAAGRFQYVNPEFARMFAAGPGDPAENIYITPQDRIDLITDLRREGQVRNREMRLRGADGCARDFLVTFMPMVHDGQEGVMGWLLDITERKQAELDLARNQQFMAAVLENINSAIYVKDLQGVYSFVNADWEKATGLRRQDVLGQSTLAINPQGQGSLYHDADMQAIRDGRVVVLEESATKPDGVHYYQVTKVPMTEGGTVTGLCNIAFDITERKRAEQSMKDSEARLRLILENSPVGVSINDEAGRPIFSNQRVVDLLGIAPQARDSRNTRDFWLHPADRDVFLAQMHRDGKVIDYQARFVRTDGTPLTVLLSSMFMDLAEGRSIVTWIYDISEREKAEAAIRQANAEQTAIFETARVGIALTKDRLIVRCNPYIERVFGYGRDELVGKSTRVLFPDDATYAMIGQGMMAAFSRGETFRYEVEYMRKDGTRFWGRVHGSMVDVQDPSRGVVLMGEDISEERAAAAALERARDVAEEATRAKSDFLANMSHEIRTPMNAIIGMSHLALQTSLDKRQRNYIEKVHRSGENLLGIINDILDFSKIEAGKMTMETIDFRLEDVMDNLANLVGMKAEDKGLELLFNAAADVPTALRGDPLRLGQVLINLGNNAVKFTERGEIVVGVEKVHEDAEGVELHFWIRDSGIGMTAEQCGKMFQSFSQADASTTRKYGGTGLGLAISKNLVERMHGRIWVESEAGKGSVFHFHARFGLQAEPMPRRMYKAEELQGLRVLVVDDNASAREILSTMARTFGLEVDVAWDGAQALALLAEAEGKQLPYDLVLMDWKMPVMDGIETMQRLQASHPKHTPSVIMVTAYGREEALASAQQHRVTLQTVLTKPVTASTLLEAIGEALGKGLVTDTRAHEKAADHHELMARLNGARLLLVEDNEMNQELAMELLRNAGVEVVVANHGQEALDILACDARFDGVLMDCQMPVMDGYTATRHIRANPAFVHLPVIAMTANAMAGDREKVLEAGMCDHIAKPLNVGEMFATIARWVRPQDAPAEAAPVDAPAAPLPEAWDPAGLAHLPGIDVRAGLATTMDNHKLYLRLLDKFREGQSDFAALFAAARADADPSAAARAAHTLKGTAGNIGAREVQAAAAELERACLDGADAAHIEARLAHTLAQLAPVIAGLQALHPPPGAAPVAAAPVDPAQAQRLQDGLARLAALLQDSDADAADAVEDLRALAQGTPLMAVLKQVESAVAQFDFDAALAALQNRA